MTRSTLRRRTVIAASLALSLGLAGMLSVRLAAYGVPALLITPCALAIFGSALSLLDALSVATATTTHRCTHPGCAFKVALTGASAAENRRYQELAAAHPHRYQP